jgi:hypothetical protein
VTAYGQDLTAADTCPRRSRRRRARGPPSAPTRHRPGATRLMPPSRSRCRRRLFRPHPAAVRRVQPASPGPGRAPSVPAVPRSMMVTSRDSSTRSHPRTMERDRHRGDVGDRDRHAHQQHHPRLAVLDLPPSTLRGMAGHPEEDDRAEDGTDSLHSGEVEVVAEPVHDHVTGHHDRYREREASPRTGGSGCQASHRHVSPWCSQH